MALCLVSCAGWDHLRTEFLGCVCGSADGCQPWLSICGCDVLALCCLHSSSAEVGPLNLPGNPLGRSRSWDLGKTKIQQCLASQLLLPEEIFRAREPRVQRPQSRASTYQPVA